MRLKVWLEVDNLELDTDTTQELVVLNNPWHGGTLSFDIDAIANLLLGGRFIQVHIEPVPDWEPKR